MSRSSSSPYTPKHYAGLYARPPRTIAEVLARLEQLEAAAARLEADLCPDHPDVLAAFGPRVSTSHTIPWEGARA